ncbi:chaperonin 10-like protein [Tricladium varicosporioides]|nr:chaperonin 10-like protein [Hymenoscyphus varicosporioides]
MPEFHAPPFQTSVQQGQNGTLVVNHQAEIPALEPDMILVKNVQVAINPTDFKMPDNFPTPHTTVGCDFAGIIVDIGPTVNETRKLNNRGILQIGDRVCGGVHGSNPLRPLVGAFAEYVVAFGDCVLKIPDGQSWAEAAAIGGAVPGTLGLALVKSLGLEIGTTELPEKPTNVLVYGGSTASGTMAIQLLKISGYRVITTCSAHNFDLVKGFGADNVLDYHSPTCAADIKALTRNGLKYALDTITSAQSLAICYAAIGRAGGKYTGLEMIPEELLANTRKTVKADWVLGISMSGERIALEGAYQCEARPERRLFGGSWFAQLQTMLNDGRLRSHPPKAMAGGFEGIISGVDILRRKGVSGEKLVYAISEGGP